MYEDAKQRFHVANDLVSKQNYFFFLLSVGVVPKGETKIQNKTKKNRYVKRALG